MITIRLPADIEQRLTALADATQKTESFYVREALERSLEDMEDAYLAEVAYERFRDSGEKTIPLYEIMKEYGMDS